MEDVVVYPVVERELAERLNKRSSLVLVKVHCGLLQRHRQYMAKHRKSLALEEFARLEEDSSHPDISRLKFDLVLRNQKDLQDLKRQLSIQAASLF